MATRFIKVILFELRPNNALSINNGNVVTELGFVVYYLLITFAMSGK